MGRSMNYASPSSIQRSAKRLVHHLHKMMQIIGSRFPMKEKVSHSQITDSSNSTKQMQMVGGHTSDTIPIYKKKSTSFCSSTPKKLRNLCYGCKKYLFEMFMEDGTWSGPGQSQSFQPKTGCSRSRDRWTLNHLFAVPIIMQYFLYYFMTVLK